MLSPLFNNDKHSNLGKERLDKLYCILSLHRVCRRDIIERLRVCLAKGNDFTELGCDPNSWYWFKNEVRLRQSRNALLPYRFRSNSSLDDLKAKANAAEIVADLGKRFGIDGSLSDDIRLNDFMDIPLIML